MRALADADRIQRLMRAIGREASASARIFFTGGATAVLLGWRETTIDVDIKIVPEQDAILRAIAVLKDSLSVNVELASPDDFIPVPEGWSDRSPFVATEGPVSFHHFDLYSQALAKIERGHTQDLDDVQSMLAAGLIERTRLGTYFRMIAPNLYRYPAIDAASFTRAVEAIVGS